MEIQQKNIKTPISHEKIYQIMQWIPLIASSLFFLKNVIAKNILGMLTIGICLFVFVSVLIFMKRRNVSIYHKELAVTIALPFLVFLISLNSGESYSDDFPLFLAVIGMTGLYLEPKFTRLQLAITSIMFVIMYLVHPEKAESLSQYILCMAVFVLAASLFYQVIKRGRAFIEISQERAEEAEKLLASIRMMGIELEEDFTQSSIKIEASTTGLQEGSYYIIQGTNEVSDNCDAVHDKIQETEVQIDELNAEVKNFESTLIENQSNVEMMNTQLQSVSGIIKESDTALQTMEEQMHEIAKIAKQINDISFKLTILSLNASVEAARAGESGSGFAVVASEMRELSESSNMFSDQVGEVVKQLLQYVEKTTEKFENSEFALEESEKMMGILQRSFDQLTKQFEFLYSNIETQNKNVNQIDSIFNKLDEKVSDMRNNSMENQKSVESIIESMEIYKTNINNVVSKTQNI